MKKRYSDEQIIRFLREADAGVSVKDLCQLPIVFRASFTWSFPGSAGAGPTERIANNPVDRVEEPLSWHIAAALAIVIDLAA